MVVPKKKATAWTSLNWASRPSRFLPHGFIGILSIATGGFLTICSVTGNLRPFEHTEYSKIFPTPIFGLFIVSMILSGLVGMKMASYAKKSYRFVFQFMGMELALVSYFSLRLVPTFAMQLGHLLAIRCLDCLLATAMVLLALSGILNVRRLTDAGDIPRTLSYSIYPAFLALLTLAVLPLHLAWEGMDWYDCVHQQYPAFGYTTAAFAYTPACWTISVIAFATTLYNRKLIGVMAMSLIFLTSLGTLAVTVISMEYHVPFVSVQRLYFPCPVTRPWQQAVLEALDLSSLTQSLLRGLGFSVRAPLEGDYHSYESGILQH